MRSESGTDRGRHDDNTFRTFPAVDVRAPVTFAVLGDHGVGFLHPNTAPMVEELVPLFDRCSRVPVTEVTDDGELQHLVVQTPDGGRYPTSIELRSELRPDR